LDEEQHQQAAGEAERVRNSVSCVIFVTSGDAI